MSVVPLGGLPGLAQPAPGVGVQVEARFVRLADAATLMGEAEAAGFLPVVVQPLRPADRGKLGLVLEEAVEDALERRGACPPGVGAATDLDSSLSDQLYRARLIEARGLCVLVTNLEGAATLSGALDSEDSAVLRFWLDAPRTRPVRLLLDETNRSLGVYGPPVALDTLLTNLSTLSGETAPGLAPLVAPEVAASSATMELSEPPPAVRAHPSVRHEPPASQQSADAPAVPEAAATAAPEAAAPAGASEPSLAGDMAQALVAELRESAEPPAVDAPGSRSALGAESSEPIADDEPSAATASDTPLAPSLFSEPPEAAAVLAPEGMSVEPPETAAAPAPEAVSAGPPEATAAPAAEVVSAEPPAEAAEPTPEVVDPGARESAPELADAGALVAGGPLHPAAASDWQSWVRDLEGARGPKPLAAVERMFAMSYVPLRDAYLRGIAPREVGPVLETWATSFAQSYREAFDALRVRGKRPTMVLDVPDAALRIGRLHGARSVQLLLVDGLRFDLGLRVELGLRARLGREVALTERLLLWSALPSDTPTQLELIGRGPDGLREFGAAPESDVPVARGHMARTPRRIKAGHRELFKLDLVEARLSEPGPPESPRLDALGVEVTDAVAELCERLPARTLLFVFGDHGFCLEPQRDGTGAAKQGGSRPEEVLVPAFAWLVGGVQ